MAKLLTAKVPFLNATEANFLTQLRTIVATAPRMVAEVTIYRAETSLCDIRSSTGVAGFEVPTTSVAPVLRIGNLATGSGNGVDLNQLILFGVSGTGVLHVAIMIS